jgi:hypothetical protein
VASRSDGGEESAAAPGGASMVKAFRVGEEMGRQNGESGRWAGSGADSFCHGRGRGSARGR